MNVHSLARTTGRSRATLVHRVISRQDTVASIARAFGISRRSTSGWLVTGAETRLFKICRRDLTEALPGSSRFVWSCWFS